ncbi:hypothetical protein OHA37_14435 [Streptomyces sp. NBC_00335]|uniref:hypothetical protein n=1 Tax=unclassified Streptomyces TaxID=2593676 RepID=UPI0022501460|nr:MULTISPECIES: hypothetical protein [unclassified Streptomyces]MCX5405079.1 hypothetical protein [Streptomyces sp. NBC_00086]
MDDIKSGAGTADFAERADRLVRAARTGSLRSPAVVAGLEEAAGRADRERAELVRAWADRLARGVDTEAVRETVLHLAAVAGRGLVDDALAAERRALLDRTAGMWRYQHHYGHPEVLIAAELAAGRMPGPAVIAAFRRTALACAPSEGLRRTLALLTEPVLNVGEPWADSALADPRWHGLLVHARTVKASRPVGAWTRTARDLVAGQGEGEARAAIVGWLGLVGRPRSLPVTGEAGADWDPYNIDALRGLAWMLVRLPPEPAGESVLGRLAGAGRLLPQALRHMLSARA